MIDNYYPKDHNINKQDIIDIILNYYYNLKLDYDKIYLEYDKINKYKLKKDIDEKYDLLFIEKIKNNEFIKIRTNFIKDYLLKSLEYLIEEKSLEDLKDESSKLNKLINNYKNEYEYYPDYIEENINKKLYNKYELRRFIINNDKDDIEDKCNKNYFELLPHQMLLKNLYSNNSQYNSLLIFHGVGVGKTCSAISIAENFKDIYAEKNKRIIILSSKNIQIGWRKTILDPKKNDNQCTGEDNSKHIKSNDNEIKINKQIKKYYELNAYASFANKVKKLLISETKHISSDSIIEKKRAEILIIEKYFSDRVLIIDEVHNIRASETNKESRDTIYYIEMVIKYSKNLKLILLTANPMYNLS